MRFALNSLASIASIASIAFCAACSTTSTLTLASGPKLEAHIVGGDSEYVYIGSEQSPQLVKRSDIKDIDYPGDGATVAGSILAGYGVVNIAVGAPQCESKGAAFCTGVFLPLAVGVPMVIWGLATHASAVRAAGAPIERTGSRIFVAPIVGTERGQASGAAIVGTF